MIGFAKKAVCLLILVLIVFPSACYSVELKKGMKFLAVRKLLIKSKWQPIYVHKGKDYTFVGVENELIVAHIEEVENCAIDKSICQFNYKKHNKCLRLYTQGERIEDMRVYRWTYECPDL